jgi:hypothetical protein
MLATLDSLTDSLPSLPVADTFLPRCWNCHETLSRCTCDDDETTNEATNDE